MDMRPLLRLELDETSARLLWAALHSVLDMYEEHPAAAAEPGSEEARVMAFLARVRDDLARYLDVVTASPPDGSAHH